MFVFCSREMTRSVDSAGESHCDEPSSGLSVNSIIFLETKPADWLNFSVDSFGNQLLPHPCQIAGIWVTSSAKRNAKKTSIKKQH